MFRIDNHTFGNFLQYRPDRKVQNVHGVANCATKYQPRVLKDTPNR